ncbi:hypothetical protein DRN86_02835 [Candidatus Geothermarchaeota archaeon]|nr:MAG: hypothetical protein DRN86_02835 [Candidatus Geothermarchaeota archaeon]
MKFGLKVGSMAVGFKMMDESICGDLYIGDKEFADGIRIIGRSYRDVSIPIILEAIRNGLRVLIIDDLGFYSKFVPGIRADFIPLKIGIDFKFPIFEPNGITIEEHVFWLKRLLEQSFNDNGRWREVFIPALTAIVKSGSSSPLEVLDEVKKLYDESNGVEKPIYLSLKLLIDNFLTRDVARIFEAIEYPKLQSILNGNFILDFSWLPVQQRGVFKAIFLLELSAIRAREVLIVVDRANRPFNKDLRHLNSDLVIKLRDRGFYTIMEDLLPLDDEVAELHPIEIIAKDKAILRKMGNEEVFKPIKYVPLGVRGEYKDNYELSEDEFKMALKILKLVNNCCGIGSNGLMALLHGERKIKSIAEALCRKGFLNEFTILGEQAYKISAKGLKAMRSGDILGL